MNRHVNGLFRAFRHAAHSHSTPGETPKEKGPENFRALMNGGGQLASFRLACRANEYWCGSLRI